jgi:hypothetical protein
MFIGFYKGPGDSVTKLITLLTMGPYSHCELFFSDGTCFSASGRSTPAVRFVAQPLRRDRWDLIELPFSPEQELHLYRFCARYIDLAFDWHGIFKFICPWLKDRANRYYCSEICILALQNMGLLKGLNPYISPNELFLTLVRP